MPIGVIVGGAALGLAVAYAMDRRTPVAGPAAGGEGAVTGERESSATGTISSVDPSTGQSVELKETDAGPMSVDDAIDMMDKPHPTTSPVKPCLTCGVEAVMKPQPSTTVHKPFKPGIPIVAQGRTMERAIATAGKGSKMTRQGTPIIASPGSAAAVAAVGLGGKTEVHATPIASISTRGMTKIQASSRIIDINRKNRMLVF